MKTPDEIKKGMGCCARLKFPNAYCDNCPYLVKAAEHLWECKSPEILTDALAYIQQLEDQIRDLTKMVPKWISVEERLPEDNANVLVYAIGNNEHSVIAMTSYTHNMYGFNIEGWRAPWQYFFYEYKITHWMQLPEPPKEG